MPTHEIIKKNVKAIASQSSIHGLPNVINTEYFVMKSIWSVVFLLAIGYCSYLIVQLIMVYFNYDVLVSISYVADYTIDFPAIVICDFAPQNRTVNDIVISCQFNTKPCDMTYFGNVTILY